MSGSCEMNAGYRRQKDKFSTHVTGNKKMCQWAVGAFPIISRADGKMMKKSVQMCKLHSEVTLYQLFR